jgi:hypothetical protein
VESKRKEEVFLRQFLKFQLPSPYHTLGKDSAAFWVKPYRELYRLVRHFGSLKFDELMLFGMQLVDFRMFDTIVEKIDKFRIAKAEQKGNYQKFRKEYLESELKEIFSEELLSGKLKTRETQENSASKFLATKASNLRDYADACFRYLRATGLVNISHLGKSISIVPEKLDEVDFFLEHTDRDPCFVDDEAKYAAHLGSLESPLLLTDNIDLLRQKIKTEFPQAIFDETYKLTRLKNLYADELEKRKEKLLTEQIGAIKDFRAFDDISNTFTQIFDDDLYDIPLMLEWNTWRAMTMLDGGNIKANLKFDDFGHPLNTAQGNMADIVCDYGDFGVTVEVTMQSGQRQYEAEGEPVARHLAKLKKETGKEAFCLFVAPSINEACIAHFYMLHKTNISYYGGNSVIVPLPLCIFLQMLDQSRKAGYVPEPRYIRHFFEQSMDLAKKSNSETEWYEGITQVATDWLEA